eukprot:9478680-Pyramimonas_sp.AAC.1
MREGNEARNPRRFRHPGKRQTRTAFPVGRRAPPGHLRVSPTSRPSLERSKGAQMASCREYAGMYATWAPRRRHVGDPYVGSSKLAE